MIAEPSARRSIVHRMAPGLCRQKSGPPEQGEQEAQTGSAGPKVKLRVAGPSR